MFEIMQYIFSDFWRWLGLFIIVLALSQWTPVSVRVMTNQNKGTSVESNQK